MIGTIGLAHRSSKSLLEKGRMEHFARPDLAGVIRHTPIIRIITSEERIEVMADPIMNSPQAAHARLEEIEILQNNNAKGLIQPPLTTADKTKLAREAAGLATFLGVNNPVTLSTAETENSSQSSVKK